MKADVFSEMAIKLKEINEVSDDVEQRTSKMQMALDRHQKLNEHQLNA